MFKFLDKFKRKQLEKAKIHKEEKKSKVKEVSQEMRSKKPKKDAREMKNEPWSIIYGPLTTEKTTVLGLINQYVFSVARTASKVQVAKAIEELYGVNVKGVNMINVSGKKVAFGRTRGQQKDWKKAIVKLVKDEKIDIYEK